MKVLMSAYACEPNRGSEPGVGWHWALQAARFHEVWVLTRSNNREVIEAELRREPVPDLHFIYHDLPRWARFWKRRGRGTNLYYLLWQATAIFPAMAADRRERFGIVHHVTFNSIESPGFLWLLRPRFVWGPIGGVHVPPAALKDYFAETWPKELWRKARKRLLRFNPVVLMAIRRARCTLATTSQAAQVLRLLGSESVIQELETAVMSRSGLPPAQRGERPANGVTVLWAGVLIHRKAPLLALDILSTLRTRNSNVQLLFVGDGPLGPRMKREIAKQRLENHARLLGRVSHHEMSALYSSADIFLFTSLHDTSGNVVLEAMSHKLPVVCLDHHGAGEIVSPDSGIKIQILNKDQVVSDFADAISRLACNDSLRRTLGAAGQERVREVYSWDRKGELLKDLYRDVAASLSSAAEHAPDSG